MSAWIDRDPNDIFLLTAPLIFAFLTSNFPTLFVLLNLILRCGSFLKIPSGKKRNSRKTTQNALSPSIFTVMSFVLKLGTPLPHTNAQSNLVTELLISLWKSRYGRKTSKTPFYPARSSLTKHNQILFSFSSDKDRRTDSRIRRKNTAQPRRESNPGSCEF